MSEPNGHDHNNVSSLDEARRRAAEKVKAERRAAAGSRAPASARDWLIGGLIIVMALGYIASFFVETATVTAGGMQ
ncbi:MAG TPA: hypothetical protein PLD46_03300 [Hyphomicrobium sp.]|nr:hypothetical protein [Hyphomicrobium sp.]